MQKKRGGRYTLEFRRMAVERMKNCSNITALAKELGIPRIRLYQWQRILDPENSAKRWRPTDPNKATVAQQLKQTQQLLARKTLEVDFLRSALQKIEARRQRSSNPGEMASTTKFEK